MRVCVLQKTNGRWHLRLLQSNSLVQTYTTSHLYQVTYVIMSLTAWLTPLLAALSLWLSENTVYIPTLFCQLLFRLSRRGYHPQINTKTAGKCVNLVYFECTCYEPSALCRICRAAFYSFWRILLFPEENCQKRDCMSVRLLVPHVKLQQLVDLLIANKKNYTWLVV